MPEIPQQVGLTPEQIAQFQVDPNQWVQSILSGEFLGANPYINELIAAMEADARRAYETGTVPLLRSNLNMGGAYGSALGSLAESRAAQDFTRGLMGQTAGVRYQDYGAERENMMRALQLLSGETVASRQGLFGARDTDVQSATNLEQTQMQTAAQRAAARMSAGARRYAADRSYAASQLGAQADYWRNLFNYSGLMRGFTGGPGESMGRRNAAPRTPDVWGGPAGGFVPANKPIGGDPWNQPGAWG